MARISIRGGSIVAALVATGFVFSAGCKEEKKTTGAGSAAGSATATAGSGSATTTTTTTTTPAEAPAGAPAAAPATGDHLGLLPKDSEIVMGVNFQQVQKSALWKQFGEPMMAKNNNFVGELQKFKDKCGFDPMTSVQSVSMGLKGIGADKPDGVVVISGLDKTKTMACLEKEKATMTAKGTTLTQDGAITFIKDKDGDDGAMTFVNDTTMIIGMGTAATPDGIKAAASGTSALKTSPAFVEMYGKINTSDSVWMLANCGSKAFDQLRSMNINCKAVFGSVNVTDGVTMDVRTRAMSPDQATQLATMAKQGAGQAAALVDKLDITTEGADMRTQVVISQQKLMTLMQMFGKQMGGGGAP